MIVITKDHERAIFASALGQDRRPAAFRGVDPNADWILTCRRCGPGKSHIIFNIHSLDSTLRHDYEAAETTGAIDRENSIIRSLIEATTGSHRQVAFDQVQPNSGQRQIEVARYRAELSVTTFWTFPASCRQHGRLRLIIRVTND